MLTAASFTVVVFSHNDASQILLLIGFGSCGNFNIFARELVLHLVCLAIERIHGAHQQIVGDVLQMTAELQPRTSHRDVVGGALSLSLDEQRHVDKIVSIPSGKRLQTLQTLRFGSNHHLHVSMVGGRCNEAIVGLSKALRWEVVALRSIKTHAVAIAVGQRVGDRIEVEPSGNGQSGGQFWTSDESKCIGVAISTTAEIAVERSDDGVLALRIVGVAVPLSDTRSASVSHDDCTNALEIVENSIAFGSCANLLATRVDDELSMNVDILLSSLTGNRSRTAQILITGVGARANQSHFHRHRIVVGRTFGFHLRDGSCSIGSERTIEMGLHLREVDIDDLVVEHLGVSINFSIGLKVGCVLASHNSHSLTSCLAQIFISVSVEGEDGTRSAQFSTHVANRSLTRS